MTIQRYEPHQEIESLEELEEDQHTRVQRLHATHKADIIEHRIGNQAAIEQAQLAVSHSRDMQPLDLAELEPYTLELVNKARDRRLTRI